MKHQSFIGLGSNLGNRKKNLAEALDRISAQAELVRRSYVYETKPWGFEDQPQFLNQAAQIRTDMNPDELLFFLKSIEEEMGREATFRYGPRNIDLDILLFDDLVYSSGKLTIPHPALPERPFVLIPLNEIASNEVHPSLQKSIRELSDGVDAKGVAIYSRNSGNDKRLPEWGKRTYIMGILNLTPDSFSGDGLVSGEDFAQRAADQAASFVRDGADILDLGAESSRPGSKPVTAEVELDRLLPSLEAIKSRRLNALISIDTWKSSVALQCLQKGADWINDIWGLTADPKMAEVISSQKAVVVLMHNRSSANAVRDLGVLGKSYTGPDYEDFMLEIKSGLENSIGLARNAGIPDSRIILDPGFGFGKTVPQNLELINRFDELKALGFPLLSGPSRKSFIGQALDLPVDEREEGTAAAVVVSIVKGADIIRVHDVKMMARVAKMTDAIIQRNTIN